MLQVGDIVKWYEEYENGPSYGIVVEIVNKTHFKVVWLDESLAGGYTYSSSYLKKV